MSKRKKIQYKETYRKGVEVNDRHQILNLIKKATHIYAKDQTIYNDETQSVTVEIHFKQ